MAREAQEDRAVFVTCDHAAISAHESDEMAMPSETGPISIK